jgi:murein DD-endopeptidase MepM/ murein hydrolase activator NlpD
VVTTQPRNDLNVVVVGSDGRFLRWISFPRWIVKAAAIIGTVSMLLNVAALIHYVAIYRTHATLVAENDILEENAKALPPIRKRLTELREEMAGWDALHAAVWKPLGGPARGAGGMGGPIGPPKSAKALDEIDVMVAHVREETRRLRALANVAKEAGGVLAALPARLPLKSAINSAFGPRLSPWTGKPEFHAGVDLAASSGTPVTATAGGTVRFAGNAAGYGVSVLLDHGAGVESRYGHLQRVSVSQGQRVERGQLIGLSGNTGRSSGPHLHYEVIVDGRPVDPRRITRN